jgi:hypothetical protein
LRPTGSDDRAERLRFLRVDAVVVGAGAIEQHPPAVDELVMADVAVTVLIEHHDCLLQPAGAAAAATRQKALGHILFVEITIAIPIRSGEQPGSRSGELGAHNTTEHFSAREKGPSRRSVRVLES